MNLQVTGMTCDHCVSIVKEALEAVAGVEKAHVELDGTVRIEGNPEVTEVLKAIEAEGYGVQIK